MEVDVVEFEAILGMIEALLLCGRSTAVTNKIKMLSCTSQPQ